MNKNLCCNEKSIFFNNNIIRRKQCDTKAEFGGLRVKFSIETELTVCNCPIVGRRFEKLPNLRSRNRATLCAKTKDSSVVVFNQSSQI